MAVEPCDPVNPGGPSLSDVDAACYSRSSASSALASFRSAVSKPLDEPVVDLGEHRTRFVAMPLLDQQGRAGRRMKVPRTSRALFARNFTQCAQTAPAITPALSLLDLPRSHTRRKNAFLIS